MGRACITRKMHTSRARLPKKLTFEPGDMFLKVHVETFRYLVNVSSIHTYIQTACAVQSTRRLASLAILYTCVHMGLMGHHCAAGAGRSCALRCSREFWTTWYTVWSSSIELLFLRLPLQEVYSVAVFYIRTQWIAVCV